MLSNSLFVKIVSNNLVQFLHSVLVHELSSKNIREVIINIFFIFDSSKLELRVAFKV